MQNLSSQNTQVGSLALAVANVLGTTVYQFPTAATASGISGMARKANGSTTNSITITTAESGNALKIYPNPTSGLLTIENAKGGEAVLYSLTGTKIWGQTIASGKAYVQLPRSLATGIYLVRFTGNDGTVSQTRLTYQP